MYNPYEPVCPSVGRLVGLSLFFKKGGKLHFHAPIGALVFKEENGQGFGRLRKIEIKCFVFTKKSTCDRKEKLGDFLVLNTHKGK